MKFLLPFLTALLTLAAAVVLLGAPSSFSFDGVAFGAAEKFMTGLLAVLSALFIVLLVIHRRRERRKRT